MPAPATTPQDVLARLNTDMVKVMQSLDFKKRMAEIGAEPIGNGADYTAAQIKSETDKFAELGKDQGRHRVTDRARISS